MPWAYFQNQAAWDAFHNAACTDHGIPRPGARQSDDAVQILAGWTDSYSAPIQFRQQGNVTTWVAHVTDDDVTRYGLGGIIIPDSAITYDEFGPITITYGGRTYTAEPTTMTYRKAKPPTYTYKGVTYDTTTGQPI